MQTASDTTKGGSLSGLTPTSTPSEIRLYLATLDEDAFYDQIDDIRQATNKTRVDLRRWFSDSRKLLKGEDDEDEKGKKKYRVIWHEMVWEEWERQYADRPVVYVSDTKEFFRYGPGVYELLPEEALDQLILPVFRNVWLPSKDGNLRQVPENNANLNFFLRMLKGLVPHKIKDFDADPNVINVKNGLYHDDTKGVTKHIPGYLSFVQLQCKYDPKAPPVPCPLWVHLVTTSLPKIRDQEILRNLMRLSLNPFRGTKEKETILVGTGKNGKDQFEEVWRNLFDEMFVTQVSLESLASYEFAKSFLLEMRLNVVGDAETNQALTNIGNFLDLTGKKYITANVKSVKRQVRAPNRCRNIFAADRFMSVTNAQYGFWRRWQPLLCTEKFDGHDEAHKEIPDLASKIVLTEMDGVIQWVMKAVPETFTEWYTPEEVKKVWTRGADPVRRFVEDHCRLSSLEAVGTNTFMETLADFCTKIDQPLPSQKTVTTTLSQEFHIPPPRDNGSSYDKDRWEYRGLGLRTSIEPTIEQLSSRLRHSLEDMGINMDLVEHDRKGKDIEDPEIKGAWKETVSRLTLILAKGARKMPSEEIDVTKVKNVEAPTTTPPEKPFNVDRMVLGHSHAQEGMLDATRKMLHEMEAETKETPVEEENLLERVVHDGVFKEEEVKEAIRILKKEGSICIPKPGLIKSIDPS